MIQGGYVNGFKIFRVRFDCCGYGGTSTVGDLGDSPKGNVQAD